MPGCYVCDRDGSGDLQPWEQVHADGLWRLSVAFDSSLPGWLVLVPRRHLEGLHELSAAEADALGPLLRAASAALVEVTGCLRTYLMLFAEAEGFAHLHVHIVPRHADLPVEHRGPGVFAYLNAPAEKQVGEAERNRIAGRLGESMRRSLQGGGQRP